MTAPSALVRLIAHNVSERITLPSDSDCSSRLGLHLEDFQERTSRVAQRVVQVDQVRIQALPTSGAEQLNLVLQHGRIALPTSPMRIAACSAAALVPVICSVSPANSVRLEMTTAATSAADSPKSFTR